MGRPTHLVVGLGNPGSRYELTRHNLGFMVVRRLSEAWSISVDRRVGHAQVGEGPLPRPFADLRVALAMPQTFMNLSGRSVAALVQHYGLPLDRVLVVYDDMDLPPGGIRLRASGGPGTHRGMQSVVESLGSGGFPRLRIGIGPAPPHQDAAAFVLEPITDRAEWERFGPALDLAVQAVQVWVTEGIAAAMNRFNASR